MILSKANLMAVKVAGTDKRDPVLHQLRVEADGTTAASNGQSMMAVEPVEGRPSALPEFEDETDVGEDGAGVPPTIVNEVIRNLPKGGLGLELGFAAITDHDEEANSAEFTTTDLTKNLKVEGPLTRKRFPEWQPVLRKAKRASGYRVCVDRRALIRLLQAMEAACPNPDHLAFIEFGSEEGDGFLVRGASVETGQHAIGYMVPIDTGGEWMKMNPWERRVMRRVIRTEANDDGEA